MGGYRVQENAVPFGLVFEMMIQDHDPGLRRYAGGRFSQPFFPGSVDEYRYFGADGMFYFASRLYLFGPGQPLQI